MELNKNQVMALVILTVLAIAAIALLRNEFLDLMNLEQSRIVMPSD